MCVCVCVCVYLYPSLHCIFIHISLLVHECSQIPKLILHPNSRVSVCLLGVFRCVCLWVFVCFHVCVYECVCVCNFVHKLQNCSSVFAFIKSEHPDVSTTSLPLHFNSQVALSLVRFGRWLLIATSAFHSSPNMNTSKKPSKITPTKITPSEIDTSKINMSQIEIPLSPYE